MNVCWLVEIFDDGEWSWSVTPDGRVPLYYTRREARACVRQVSPKLVTRIRRIEIADED